ncbi:vesicle docking protein isoform X3 [Tasmannia lanceolata]
MDPANKMVVITSRLLSDAHRYILRCLSTHQNVLRCTIFTSIAEIAHSAYVDSPLGPDAFREYESLLLQDYEELVRKSERKENSPFELNEFRETSESKSDERYSSREGSTSKDKDPILPCMEDEGWSNLVSGEDETPNAEASSIVRDLDEDKAMSSTENRWLRLVVSVQHFPMILCPLSPRVFVLPSEGAISEACLSNDHEDALSPGLPSMNTGLPSDGEDTPPGATLTAHFLYHMAAKMDLKMEIFSLGDLSKTIGKILTDMSSLYDVGRRNKRSAGLLLIDRTLDLITPCSHGDSLVDRMLASLPRRDRTTTTSHVKGSQIQKKHSPDNLQRDSLDVRIPLHRIFSEEHPTDSIPLSESIAAFMSGWDSTNSGFLISDAVEHNNKAYSGNSLHSDFNLLSGSFVATENYQGVHYLEAIFDRKTKDGALLVKKWLQETLRREKLTLNRKYRPNSAIASELHSMVKMLASNQTTLMRNKGIIQFAVAAETALSEPHCSRWDAFVSAERILRLSAGDTSQSLSGQICDLINKNIQELKKSAESSRGLLSFQDALLLAITGYILAGENFPTSGSAGPFSWEEERSLKESIVDAILENPAAAKFRFLNSLEEELEANLEKIKSDKTQESLSSQSKNDDFDDQWGSWDDEDTDHDNEQAYGGMQLRLELRDRVDQIFKIFHKLSGLKRRNPTFKEGMFPLESNFVGDSYVNRGLLYKLLTMVLGNYDIPGLEYHSSAVGRFFKSGFGRFGLGQAKPKLGDQSVLLVFVVGGINGLEVREAQEAVSESGRPDVELILGGTTFLTPDDMFDLLLGTSSYI